MALAATQAHLCMAGVAFPALLRLFAWQAWPFVRLHSSLPGMCSISCLCSVASRFILFGRCSVSYSSASFRVASVVLSGSFCVISRCRCGPCRDTSAFCVAGVAFPSLLHHFTWQVWRFVRPKCSWRGRCSSSYGPCLKLIIPLSGDVAE